MMIEDDSGLASVLAHYLEARGHRTVIAASAEEANRLLAGGARPDLVLLDINLPDESGWAFLRSGVLEEAGCPPVFIMSAVNVTSARLHEFGCAGYLPKPFAISTLLAVVERHSHPAGEPTGVASASAPRESEEEIERLFEAGFDA